MKVCELVNVEVDMRITSRDRFSVGYSLCIREDSEKVKKRRKFQEREKKVVADYKYITEAVKREGIPHYRM